MLFKPKTVHFYLKLNCSELVNKEAGKDIPEDDIFVNNVTNKFNDSLLFGADDLKIAYTIRDPIINSKAVPI